MLITLAFIPVSITGAIVGFLLFRLFDVIKPWPANRLEALHGGLGIMADDAMAAVYGNVAMRLLVVCVARRMARVKPIASAAIIAVGSELLTPSKIDTNSLFITEQLNLLGIDVKAKAVVGDDSAELEHVLRSWLARADLVVMCGGLGPTDDDLTREVVAAVLERPLAEDEAITARLRARFASRGLPMPMPESNRRQAMVPRGAQVLANARGSAPGLWIDHEDRLVLLLPGPPRELRPMLTELVEGPLKERSGGSVLVRRIVRVAGRFESHVDEKLHPLYGEWEKATPPIAATILASLGSIELHVSTRAATREAAGAVLERAVAEAVDVLGPDVYSTDGRLLEAVVGDLLVERGLRIGVAESCTGGLLASRLTDVPGSSRYVDQGVVVYSNEAKTQLLGVPAGSDSRTRRGERTRWACDGRGHQGEGACWRRCRRDRHRRTERRHTREARRHRRGGRGDGHRSARADVSVLRRAGAGEVSGVAGGARHGQEDAAGVRLFVAVDVGADVQRSGGADDRRA